MPPSSPWKFLTALDGESDDDRKLLDLTRRKELEIVVNMVVGSKVSLLYAFSGNGKTSLINAGIVPFFQNEGYAIFQTRPRPPHSLDDPVVAFKQCILRHHILPLIRSKDMRELEEARRVLENIAPLPVEQSAFPVEALKSIVNQLEKQVQPLAGEKLVAEFRRHMSEFADRPLDQFLAAAQEFLGSATRILIICDQFEELFVHYSNTSRLREFVRQTGEIWKESALNVQFLFSMREDWVGSMIEFRDVMPDIFNKYYKLNPIRRGPAEQVLAAPLSSVNISVPKDALDRILDDLVNCYTDAQRDRYSAVRLTEPSGDDSFLELPALQVVADKMWLTCESQKEPFSLAHYESLRTIREGPQEGTSPADIVLDDYWLSSLNASTDPRDLPPDYWKELRIDALYLLTDSRAHRRALSGDKLVQELNVGPRRELGLAEVTPQRLEIALGNLIVNRLVRESELSGNQRQYELAHDFAVRSVIKVWRALDRRRTGALALLAKERERAANKLRELSGLERRLLRLLEIAPALLVIGLAVLTALVASSPEYLVDNSTSVYGWIAVGLAASIVGIAAMAKQRSGVLLGVLAGVGAPVYFSVMYASLDYPGPTHMTNSTLVFFASFAYLGSLLLLWPRMVAIISRDRLHEPVLARIATILSNEVAEGMSVMLVPASLVAAFPTLPNTPVRVVFGSLVIWPILSAWFLARSQRSLGLLRTPWWITRTGGSKPGFWRCLVRQFLFLIWLGMNLASGAALTQSAWLFPILWLTLGPLIIGLSKSHRNWYDIWTRLTYTDQRAAQPTDAPDPNFAPDAAKASVA